MTLEQTRFMTRVAALLPGKWKVSDASGWAGGLIRDDDKLNLLVTIDSNNHKGMIHVSYSALGISQTIYEQVYDDKNEKVSYPSINISVKKDDVSVAKDIVRRILKDAEYVHSLVIKKLNEKYTFQKGTDTAIKVMSHACGTEPEKHYQTGELTGEIRPYAKGRDFKEFGYGSFHVNGPDSVSLKLDSMSLKTANRLAHALREIINK